MKLVSRQLLFFVVAGGSAAAVNFGSGVLVRLISTTSVAYNVSVVVGFTAGTVVSFFMNRRYTFQVSDEPIGPQAVRFGVAALSGVGLAWLFAIGLLVLVRRAAPSLSATLAESASHIGAIVLATFYNFAAMKFFALKRPT